MDHENANRAANPLISFPGTNGGKKGEKQGHIKISRDAMPIFRVCPTLMKIQQQDGVAFTRDLISDWQKSLGRSVNVSDWPSLQRVFPSIADACLLML